MGYSPWGHKESDTTESLILSLHLTRNTKETSCGDAVYECFLPEIAKDISPASDQGVQVAKRKRQKMICFLWLFGCIGI